MGIPRRFTGKGRQSFSEVDVELLSSARVDSRTSTSKVWDGIWTMCKYVLFFCLGMVVGSIFLQYGDVQKRCFESMVAVGFSTERGKSICYKNQPVFGATSLKFDCMPRDASAVGCKNRGCIWEVSTPGVPYCYFPDKYGVYSNTNVSVKDGKVTAFLERKIKSPYPKNVDRLKFEACAETEDRLHVKVCTVMLCV